MNMDIVWSMARQLLTAGGSVLVGKGILDSGQVEGTVGAVILLASVVWSIIKHKKKA